MLHRKPWTERQLQAIVYPPDQKWKEKEKGRGKEKKKKTVTVNKSIFHNGSNADTERSKRQ